MLNRKSDIEIRLHHRFISNSVRSHSPPKEQFQTETSLPDVEEISKETLGLARRATRYCSSCDLDSKREALSRYILHSLQEKV